MARSGDRWAFEDLGPEGAMKLAAVDAELSLDAIYRDPLGVIVPGDA